MKKGLLFCLLAVSFVEAKTYSVLDFGAVGDSATLNTRALQQAIDTCSETKGCLVFPSGAYITGTLFIKSHVHIVLEEGAVLYASVNLQDYPDIDHHITTNVEAYADHAFLYGNRVENISITGKGRICGRGGHPVFNLMRESPEHMHRPYLIQFVKCRNVRIEGIELYNPAFWLQHYLACDYVFLNNLLIHSHAAANNDGMDIDDCRNVTVSNCILYCEDDALCFKSCTPYGTENVTISNCIVRTNCNAIKFGTDGHTAFRDITISNVVINEPVEAQETFFGTTHGICGIAIEAVDGTHLENLNFSNITIRNTDTPFYIKLGDRLRKSDPSQPDKSVGICRNITFSNMTVSGVSEFASNISGMPGYYVENIMFNNIVYESTGYADYDVNFLLNVPEKSNNYPSPEIYGVFPAHAFYVRHVKNITFSNMQISTKNRDTRYAFVLDDVQGVRISEVDFHSEGNPAPLRLINTRDAMITLNHLYDSAEAFLTIHGDQTENIMVTGNNMRKAGKQAHIAAEVKKRELKFVNNWK